MNNENSSPRVAPLLLHTRSFNHVFTHKHVLEQLQYLDHSFEKFCPLSFLWLDASVPVFLNIFNME